MAFPLHMTLLPNFAQCEVIGIGHFGQSLWKGMGRAPVQLCWSASFTQCAMRPLLVVLAAEAIEGALLRAQGAPGWLGSGRFERAVHPFMAAVLLRLARLDALRHDAELEQPHRQLTESTERDAGEWNAIIGADRTRQSIVTEHRFETGPGAAALGPRQPLATEQVAAVVVADRQRIAALAITEPELAFEVGTPDVVRSAHRSKRLRLRWHLGSVPTPRHHQTVPLQNLAHRTHGRPAGGCLFSTQPSTHGHRSPTRMTSLQRHDRRHLLGGSRIRMSIRGTRPIDQPLATFRFAALHPFISGRSADIETATQLAHRKFTAPPSAYKSRAFFHGTGLLPRHRASSLPHTLTNL